MELISLENAINILLQHISPIKQIEEKSILDSLGFILSEDIYSPINNPPFNRSPLDGFSFNSDLSLGASKNNPKTLTVHNEIYAGDHLYEDVPSNMAVRIMTGAPIPNGCDCVIKQEEVIFNENSNLLTIFRELKKYENFCFLGEDLSLGDLVMNRGEIITYSHIGVLASLGIENAKVFKKPKIGILSLGSELTMPGTELKNGQIYNSNLFTIASKLNYLGVEAILYPPLKDDIDEVSNFIDIHLDEIDLLITTGGVSVGKKDIMHDVLKKINAERLFWKVDIQPGTPVLASLKNEKLILSLSGNPFASLVNFELLGRPVLDKLSSGTIKKTSTILAEVVGNFSKKSIKRRFIRGYYSEGKVYINNDKHSSGTISSLLGKNSIVEISSGTPFLIDGDKVKVILID
ncbi:molybdopterin molybdotransferase MoeA [uncultured Cetobacterium sp.]|uniref:molybdopterin molybdotransferase MoeA n=1 Tax=uncultured Cetobacterium sp. TaxID=527638 RepID=UPI00262FE59A|nr:molybdopterin molybdotransferase MoeA [uncultured Cetobacterium sp.]